ncbi:ADP-ribose pyrophosphatase YjhB, NUDIX family [Geosporobacter subterraneus DSM 17957]|uniref:ADP-ribose pyrophosphatase YjhB, NUDIX family n=1 Tax=Geosporobacter subterraneus DSM 17957 TaxID=1121919 RepID=A0A1M6JCF4_9FIRM|nr:NUDIX hydrolase [Geosporobacter subterraneus]SHJ44353.1 ADP-ribose pyrophosphatase YjhB, NUDIX family [Geosporobacter subterraneus DSM 17957]
MREEISSGGVVVFGNAILLLRKYNGDWVLPKGKVEIDEETSNAAVREVFEEGGVKAEVLRYLGKINYSFKNSWQDHETVNKTVHWYLMKARNMECIPLKDEGFIEAKFVHMNRAIELAKYDDEREIIEKAIKQIEKDLTGR